MEAGPPEPIPLQTTDIELFEVSEEHVKTWRTCVTDMDRILRRISEESSLETPELRKIRYGRYQEVLEEIINLTSSIPSNMRDYVTNLRSLVTEMRDLTNQMMNLVGLEVETIDDNSKVI